MIRENFNAGWQFEKRDGHSFLDSFSEKPKTIAVHLPHDAMIHEQRDPAIPNGAQTGFYPGGSYIYQKRFTAPEIWRGRPVFLAFEGVYQTAMVFVNGFLAAKSVNGYADFTAELSPYLHYGEENLVKVLADNSKTPNSRWYSGSGIYRSVKLLVGGRAYLPPDAVRITTREIGEGFALLDVTACIRSFSTQTERITVRQQIQNAQGGCLQDSQQLTLLPGAQETVSFRYCLKDPALWSVETPNLYQSTLCLLAGEEELDRAEDSFGVRTLSVDSEHGLRINGKTVKLRGACIHHDNGILGAATLDMAEEYRCKKLKEAGFNALRSSHHPMGRSLLAACDRSGLLVMDELSDIWNLSKNAQDYAQYFSGDWEQTVEKIVAKDYNHPCVVLYCIGNEIADVGSQAGSVLNRAICNRFRALDPTRYTTNALNGLMAAGPRIREIIQDIAARFAPPSAEGSDAGSNALNSMMDLLSGESGDALAAHPLMTEALSGCSDSCDIVGLNYLTGRHLLEHALHPHKAVLGTETYPADIVRLWRIVEENPHIIGDFTWAGYDYLGEAGCGIFHYDGTPNFSSVYPERTAYIGDLDLIGCRRPISYLRETVFGLRKAPYIAVGRMEHIGESCHKTPWMFKDNIASWTWPGFEGKTASVDVYCACEEAELFLNGASLGRRPVEGFTATFAVPYAPGTLKAVGYTGGAPDGECELHTVQQAALRLTPDRTRLAANGEDVAFCLIHFADENGSDDLFHRHRITALVEGAGRLEALGSANPSSQERYDTPQSETYDGYCLAAIRAAEAPGTVRVTVCADGDVQETLTISVE